MKYVFLDTNVFLQFKDFEQIPWGELVWDNDFTIIVSDVNSVINEEIAYDTQ